MITIICSILCLLLGGAVGFVIGVKMGAIKTVENVRDILKNANKVADKVNQN